MEENLIEKKAELILGGDVRLPEGFEMPFRVSRSSAGPGAGHGSAVFAFGKYRVKKTISPNSGEFQLFLKPGGYGMLRNGKPFLEDVRLVPVVFHCPEQAFFNLDNRCRFNCAFCSTPQIERAGYRPPADGEILEKILEAMKTQKVVSISLTSGVFGSVDDTVERFASCVKTIRAKLPDIPIGVEPYAESAGHLKMLKESGADEIKLNLESPRKDIFSKVCPELDWEGTWNLLNQAVSVFGKGKVSSNIIFGMGETDEDMEACVEKLCRMGVVPTLRALRSNSMNSPKLTAAIGPQPPVTKERILNLAHMEKRILSKYGLTTLDSRTMCLECTCCDIVPFRNL